MNLNCGRLWFKQQSQSRSDLLHYWWTSLFSNTVFSPQKQEFRRDPEQDTSMLLLRCLLGMLMFLKLSLIDLSLLSPTPQLGTHHLFRSLWGGGYRAVTAALQYMNKLLSRLCRITLREYTECDVALQFKSNQYLISLFGINVQMHYTKFSPCPSPFYLILLFPFIPPCVVCDLSRRACNASRLSMRSKSKQQLKFLWFCHSVLSSAAV